MASIFIMSKAIHHRDTESTGKTFPELMWRDISPSPPSGPAENCRFPAGRVHSLAPKIHRQRLLQIVLDYDPVLLSPDFGWWRRPSNRKPEPERKSSLGFRRAASFPLAAALRPASTSATTRPPTGRWANRPAAAKR